MHDIGIFVKIYAQSFTELKLNLVLNCDSTLRYQQYPSAQSDHFKYILSSQYLSIINLLVQKGNWIIDASVT